MVVKEISLKPTQVVLQYEFFEVRAWKEKEGMFSIQIVIDGIVFLFSASQNEEKAEEVFEKLVEEIKAGVEIRVKMWEDAEAGGAKIG